MKKNQKLIGGAAALIVVLGVLTFINPSVEKPGETTTGGETTTKTPVTPLKPAPKPIVTTPTPTNPTPVVVPPAYLQAVIAVAAERYGVEESEVEIIDITEDTWPTTCLGLQRSGEACAQMIVDGYEILVEIYGTNAIYRVSDDGSIIRSAERS